MYCGNGVTSAVDLLGGLTIQCVSDGHEVRCANEIGVHQTSVGTNEGGLFDVHVQSIEGIGGEITIVLVLSIYMDRVLRKNAEFAFGELSEFAPHDGAHDNSMGRNGVYEAILDHERAHATFYLNHQKVFFGSILRMLNIDNGIRDYDEVFDLVERAFNAAWNYRKIDSNADANAATINWYNSHHEWRRLSPVGSMERWVKE